MTTPTKQSTDNLPRMFRGGSWIYTSATLVRAAYRDGDTPMLRINNFGFRCSQRGARQPLTGGFTQ